MYSKYKSPLGYSMGEDNIDTYGVDHSRFSIRDELSYQLARRQREKEIIKKYNELGITDNYPQSGTDFWGKAEEHNYGFGNSNTETQPKTTQDFYTSESAWGYPNNSQSSFYSKMGRPYNLQPDKYKLGTLSGLYESNNGQKLWNNGNLDKTGGWSYGTYQIETKKGTMNDYLNYLGKKSYYQNFYNALQQAGGYDAALSGSDGFKAKWKELSDDPEFLESQYDFIIGSKLTPAIRLVNDIKGLNLDERSPIIKDVLFSTATQHGQGGASDIFHSALGFDTSDLNDEDIVNKIYQERSNVGKYFRKSSIEIQNNLKNIRFPNENAKALKLLKHYPY